MAAAVSRQPRLPLSSSSSLSLWLPPPKCNFSSPPVCFRYMSRRPHPQRLRKSAPKSFPPTLCDKFRSQNNSHIFRNFLYQRSEGGTRSSIRLLLLFLTAVEPNAWAPCAKRPPSSWAYFVPGPTCKNVCSSSSILCRVVYVCAETARQSMQFEKRALCTWMEPSSHWAFIEKFLIGIVICKFVIV